MSGCPDITVLEGPERAPEVAIHVRDCGACQRLIELMDDRVDDCAQVEVLLAADSLSTEESRRLERHLAVCSACRELALLGDDGAGAPSRYDMGAEVGRGGMGRVYDARDRQLERPVAVKVLRPGAGREAAARFLREALVTARLQHPSIVAVYEMGQLSGGEPFYAMRKIQGATLDAALRDAGTIAERLALLPTVLAAAEAVAYAHHEGVIHRDLKPSNIMIGPFGETSVLDWGVAKVIGEVEDDVIAGPYRTAEREAELTSAGAVLGTPQYMSPEQARAEPVDERSDVYAFGAILYILLSGRPPYDGQTSREVVEQARRGEPPPINEVAPDAPGDLRAIATKAMARDPAGRYATAAALADDLRRYQTGKLVSAHAYSLAQLTRRWVAHHRGVVAVAGLALAVLVAGAVLSVRRIATERDRATESMDIAIANNETAQRERERAHGLSLSLLENQGRRELLDGRRDRALVYLSAAYEGGLDTPALRFLLADAMQEIDGQVSQISYSRPVKCEFDHRGARIAVADSERIALYGVHDGGLIRELGAPGAVVATLLFSPDDRQLIVSDEDGWLRRYDLETGEVLQRVTAHAGPARSVVMYADGTRIVSAGLKDGMLKIWNARDLALVHETRAASSGVSEVRVSPDGSRIVTLGMGDVATVWNARTGAKMRELRGHQGRVISPGKQDSFSPDGKRIVLGDTAGTIKIWDVGTGRALLTLDDHPAPVVGVFDRRGERILVTDVEGRAYVADAGTGRRISALVGHAGAVLGGRFLEDGTRVATTSVMDRSTKIWEPSSGALIMDLDGLAEWSDHPDDLFVIDDGHHLRIRKPGAGRLRHSIRDSQHVLWGWFTASGHLATRTDGAITLRDPANGEILTTWPPTGPTLATASDGSIELVVRGTDLELRRRDGTVIRALVEVDSAIATSEMSPDDGTLVVATENGLVHVFETTSGARIGGTRAGGARVHAIAFADRGDRIAVAHVDRTVGIWTSRGELQRVCGELPLKRIEGVKVSPLGSRVVLNGTDAAAEGASLLVDAESCALLGDLTKTAAHAFGKQFFSADDRRLLAGGHVFDAVTGEHLAGFEGAAWADVGLSPDGTMVATVGEVVAIHRADTGEVIRTLDEGGFTWHAEWAPSSRLLYATHIDGVARVWDVATGRLLAELTSERARAVLVGNDMRSAAFPIAVDPRGRFVATTGPGGNARIWDIAPELRSAGEISKLVDLHSRWRLDGGVLAAKEPTQLPGFDPARAAAAAVANPARAPADVLSCDQLGKLRSLDDAEEANLRIANTTDESIRVSWIDPAGEEVPYFELAPWEDGWRVTWTSHPFVVRDAKGNCIAIVRGKPGISQYVHH